MTQWALLWVLFDDRRASNQSSLGSEVRYGIESFQKQSSRTMDERRDKLECRTRRYRPARSCRRYGEEVGEEDAVSILDLALYYIRYGF